MSTAPPPQYVPALDGVRAFAVLAVVLYHAEAVSPGRAAFGGGFLGVSVFFTLSGFLITSLILEEFDRSGRIDFAKFYLGRARRLLPPLVLLLAVVAVAAAFFVRDAASQVRADTVASLFYVNNWLHDYYYDSGFTEQAGNAQFFNYGRGGAGGDVLRAESQDSAIGNTEVPGEPAQ